tara:strand:- start:68 stop:673 length:606 start_codon:yes stop_codon:yes gene_type:complete
MIEHENAQIRENYKRWPSPAFIVWLSNREEDKLLERFSTVEAIWVNDYEEYVHENFICDPASDSYQEVLNDPNWGNGNAETLNSKIESATAEFEKNEREAEEELIEFREWKKSNKELPREVIQHDEVIKQRNSVDLEFLEGGVEKEQIFKLKLDMFEKDFVRNASREKKSELRKAEGFFDLVSIYLTMSQQDPAADGNEPS